MRKVLVGFLAVLLTTSVYAQDEAFKRQQAIYEMAITFSDLQVAKNALYNMITMKPNNLGLLDSLGMLYFEQKAYVSAAIVGQQAAQLNPNNLLALELAGTSFDNLGLADKALEHFEPLYLKNNDINVLYKIAFLQYRLKRYNDAITSADIVMNDPKSGEVELVFAKPDNTAQNIKMKAAALRLKGLVEMDRQNNTAALDYFQKVLEISPDFEIVKLAVEELQKQ